MIGFLFLLLLLSLSATTESKCIETFKELEQEILFNDQNLHSLSRAFFPTNQYPGILVKIHYYINSTDDDGNSTIPVHPVAFLLSHKNILYSPNYTFYWAFSPVFIYFDYRIIQALSFYLLRFEPHFAYIVIPEFCSNINNNTIMELINDVTTWMKSYAVNGQFSFGGVLEHRLQGFGHNNTISYDTVISSFIIVALLYGFGFLYGLGLVLIVKYYKEVSSMLKWSKKKQQRFRFESIFWAAIITIFLLDVLVLALWLGYILELDNFWGFENESVTYIIIPVTSLIMGLFITLNLVLGVVISYLYTKNNIKCSCNGVVNFIAHVWGVWTVTTTATILPLLLFGLMLRILISPEQIFAVTVLVLTISLTLYIYITFCIDKLIDIKLIKSDNAQLQRMLKAQHLKSVIGLLKCGIFLFFLIIMLSIVYVQVILFNGVDNIGIVDGAAHLFMSLLLAFIVWMIKKEYDKFKNNEEENDETNDEMTTEVPHPHSGTASPTNDEANQEINENIPLYHTETQC